MMSSTRTDESFLADKAGQEWVNLIVRGSTQCPTDIDGLLEGANTLAQRNRGSAVFPENGAFFAAQKTEESPRATIAVLLDDAEERVADDTASEMAIRYAALAIEKQCDIVILTHQNNAGYERFGFRVERIAGRTEAERQACIDQILRFWDASIVI